MIKKPDCHSKMGVKIHTTKQLDDLCEVELWWNHNHSVDCHHLSSFSPILPATKHKFHNYAEQGMSALDAFHHHATLLVKDIVTILLLAYR